MEYNCVNNSDHFNRPKQNQRDRYHDVGTNLTANEENYFKLQFEHMETKIKYRELEKRYERVLNEKRKLEEESEVNHKLKILNEEQKKGLSTHYYHNVNEEIQEVNTERKRHNKGGKSLSKHNDEEKYVILEREAAEWMKKYKDTKESRARTVEHCNDILKILYTKNLDFGTAKESIESYVQHIILENESGDASMSMSRSYMPERLIRMEDHTAEVQDQENDE